MVFLTGPPLNFLSTKSLYDCLHFEKFQVSLHGILYLENLGGVHLKKDNPVEVSRDVLEVSRDVLEVSRDVLEVSRDALEVSRDML